MKDTPPHLKALEEIERNVIPGLVEVLREEGIDTVKYALWDATRAVAPRLHERHADVETLKLLPNLVVPKVRRSALEERR